MVGATGVFSLLEEDFRRLVAEACKLMGRPVEVVEREFRTAKTAAEQVWVAAEEGEVDGG